MSETELFGHATRTAQSLMENPDCLARGSLGVGYRYMQGTRFRVDEMSQYRAAGGPFASARCRTVHPAFLL